jgi:hypothetical protein
MIAVKSGPLFHALKNLLKSGIIVTSAEEKALTSVVFFNKISLHRRRQAGNAETRLVYIGN